MKTRKCGSSSFAIHPVIQSSTATIQPSSILPSRDSRARLDAAPTFTQHARTISAPFPQHRDQDQWCRSAAAAAHARLPLTSQGSLLAPAACFYLWIVREACRLRRHVSFSPCFGREASRRWRHVFFYPCFGREACRLRRHVLPFPGITTLQATPPNSPDIAVQSTPPSPLAITEFLSPSTRLVACEASARPFVVCTKLNSWQTACVGKEARDFVTPSDPTLIFRWTPSNFLYKRHALKWWRIR
ncbi:hypothetical protein BDZ88DRAFT_25400 [Geranomyces variabilis]|nr:hypothetical protein BDZ88DRAFT_25400 [Geranomyces variabilis]